MKKVSDRIVDEAKEISDMTIFELMEARTKIDALIYEKMQDRAKIVDESNPEQAKRMLSEIDALKEQNDELARQLYELNKSQDRFFTAVTIENNIIGINEEFSDEESIAIDLDNCRLFETLAGLDEETDAALVQKGIDDYGLEFSAKYFPNTSVVELYMHIDGDEAIVEDLKNALQDTYDDPVVILDESTEELFREIFQEEFADKIAEMGVER